MRITTAFALSMISSLIAIAPASAATYTFQGNNLPGNTRTGDHTNITATYNNNTDLFTWSSTFTENGSGTLAEGAWLVLSDGANPKKHVDEYAILYLDGHNETVSIYNYDGANSANSYRSEHYLGSTALNVIDTGNARTFEFSLDATDINDNTRFGSDWQGIRFDDNIGVWFHGAANLTTSYRADGSLEVFRPGVTGWYDTANQTATAVPEPGSIAALGMIGLVAVAQRRKRSS